MRAMPTLLALSAAFLLPGCGPKPRAAIAPANTANIFQSIKIDEVHWNTDWKSGDAGVVTSHYAPNATLMLPGAPTAAGSAAIRAAIQKAMDDKGFTLMFASDKVDVAASGDLAAARGTYTETSTDPTSKAIVTEKGNYVTVYKPQPDGAWKAVWDINTPSTVSTAASGAQ